MRTLLSSLVLAVVAATAAAGQRGPTGARHEFGIDVAAAYVKPENVDGGIGILSPVDIRVGFVSARGIQWEPRLTLAFSSIGPNDTYALGLGMNALFRMGRGTSRQGPYYTVGGALTVADDGTDSGAALSINGGVGKRSPYGSGATRLEGFLQYDFENTSLGIPNTLSLGVRFGVSLWH